MESSLQRTGRSIQDIYAAHADRVYRVAWLYMKNRCDSEDGVQEVFVKVYYFDEGTFAVSYYVNLPSGGEPVLCYGYNSVYSTLSSGHEIVSRIEDPQALQTRTHTAPDGTVLTILYGGSQAFLYTYLDNSFFEEEITASGSLTDADLDYLADFLHYQNIGR